MAAERTIERISALLAKAERTDSSAEAEAYLMKAQALATAASIDLALARSRIVERERRTAPVMRTTVIGEKGKRANRHLISLFIVIAHANEAHVDIAHDSTYVIVYGMPTDLDVIEALFTSIALQMIQAANAWLALGSWRGQSYLAPVTGSARKRIQRPHTAQTAKVSFLRGFIARIEERLHQARSEAETAILANVPDAQGALVLREKAGEVKDFHRANSRARGSWGGYSGSVARDLGSAAAAGRHAASNASLGRQQRLPGKEAIGPGAG